MTTSHASALPLTLNGYTELPLGKIAAVVTYLEMLRPPPRREGTDASPSPGPWALVPVGDDLDRYRSIYRRVGERWLWFSRLALGDAALRQILRHPEVDPLILTRDGQDMGLLELDFRRPGECEIVFFGVVPEAIGTGAGRFMMDEAVARAFARPIVRLWLHTCTLDHPAAMGFYLSCGFKPYKRAIEVADDPRLMGLAAPTAAPHAPIIGPEQG